METKIKAAGYVRVSTAIQASEGESLETQKTQITEYIAHQKWELTTIYADEGATGTKVEYRTQFEEMKKDAKGGKFNVVVFTKVSRFGRNTRDFLNASHELEQIGVRLISIKENFDSTTPYGKMILTMLAGFAEWEHETIRDQTYSGKMNRWKDNRAFIGQTPLGYKWNKALNKLEVIEEEAKIYREIVSMYLDLGMSIRDIAIELNKKGVTTTRINKDGKKRIRSHWYNNTVALILKNPIYYGHYVVNQVKYTDGKRGAGTKRTKERKSESEAITIPVEQPLIPKSEWDRIQKTAEDRKVKSKRSNEQTEQFFLMDSLVCGRCGSKMNKRFGTDRKDGSILRYYFCYYSGSEKRAIEAHRQQCSLPNIQAELIERKVWNKVTEQFIFVKPKDFLKNFFNPEKLEQEINDLISTIFHFEAELGKNLTARKNIKKLYGDDRIDINEIKRDLIDNDDEKIAIEGKIAEANDKVDKLRALQKQEKEVFEFITKNRKQLVQLHNDIDNLSGADRKKFIEVMLKEPIRVDWYDVNNEKDEAVVAEYGQLITDFKLHFNIGIIKKFIDEGKIRRLNPYSTHYNSAAYT